MASVHNIRLFVCVCVANLKRGWRRGELFKRRSSEYNQLSHRVAPAVPRCPTRRVGALNQILFWGGGGGSTLHVDDYFYENCRAHRVE